jgi:hypothetical protein
MGTSRFACGTAGATCAQCMMGKQCVSNACVSSPDGGSGAGAIGAACGAAGANCAQPGFCLPESGFAGPTGFPGGYCTAQCGGGGNGCPNGSTCVNGLFFGGGSTCMADCAASGTCRTGYVCTMGADAGAGYCRPSCVNGNLAACPTGQTCSTATGQCQ